MLKIKLIFSLLTKREKRQLVFVLFAMILMGFMEVIGVGSISPFMSIATNPEVIETNTYLNYIYDFLGFKKVTDFVFALGVAVIVFITVNNIARAGISFLIRYYSGKRMHSVSLRLMKQYMMQPYIYFLNVNTSDISKNILSEVNTYINKVLIISLQLATNVIIAFAIITLLIFVNPLMAVAISGILGTVYFLIFSVIRRFLSKKGDERAKVNALKYKYVSEAFGGIKDVKLLGREDIFLQLFTEPSIKYAMNDAISEVVAETPKFLMETLAFGGILGVMLFMLSRGGNLNDFLPALTLYVFGGYRLLPALQKVFSGITKIRYNLPIVKLLYNDFSSLPKINRVTSPEFIKKIDFKTELKLENIVFAYPGTSENILNNQNLTIKANNSVGFVGPTGCGKTTTIDIILGLLQIDSGRISVDDTEITSVNVKDWQSILGYVPQSIFLIDDTIKRNIAFGVSEDQIDMKAVERAAQIANLHQFVENELEHGYDTIVGERGIRLSGGQRQRIGIARAVYHNPAVLILDEATSALDGLTEGAIMDAIGNLSHKKTIIMIAHRLTTVKDCDQIFIMDKGQIVDSGQYDELIKRNESFRKMAEGSK